jgi:hypothetical protein
MPIKTRTLHLSNPTITIPLYPIHTLPLTTLKLYLQHKQLFNQPLTGYTSLPFPTPVLLPTDIRVLPHHTTYSLPTSSSTAGELGSATSYKFSSCAYHWSPISSSGRGIRGPERISAKWIMTKNTPTNRMSSQPTDTKLLLLESAHVTRERWPSIQVRRIYCHVH